MTDSKFPETEDDLDQTAEAAMEAQLPELVRRVEEHAGQIDEPIVKQLLLFMPRLVAFLSRLARSNEIKAGWKLRCAMVVAYVFSPIDLIPDFLVPFGLIDDLYLSLLLLDNVFNRVPKPIVDRCWDGGREVIDTLSDGIAAVAAKLPTATRKPLDLYFGDAAKD